MEGVACGLGDRELNSIRCDGNGDGSSYGSGDGYGDGSGYGDGNGRGDGSGNGNGYGKIILMEKGPEPKIKSEHGDFDNHMTIHRPIIS